MTTQPGPTLFGLDAADIGNIARDAFRSTDTSPLWPQVGAIILGVLLAERAALLEPKVAPDEAESRKQEHIKRVLAHLGKSK